MSEAFARQVPSVGRVVHYQTTGFAQYTLAAIVCAVDRPGDPASSLNLAVFDPWGKSFPLVGVPYGAGKDGCWTWPAYVAPAPAAPESDE